jgi:putative DNA methylase
MQAASLRSIHCYGASASCLHYGPQASSPRRSPHPCYTESLKAGRSYSMNFRQRGYLPHLEIPDAIYFLTFRLYDSLPANLLKSWKDEYNFQKSKNSRNETAIKKIDREFFAKIEKYLDRGLGACWLIDPRIATLVSNAFRYFDGHRYHLYVWTIMPSHVHILVKPVNGYDLDSIIHSWKSYTANQANLLLGRKGHFWDHDYFDRIIRSSRHFEFTVRYILNNPVKAGLCAKVFPWPWYGCCEEVQNYIRRFEQDQGEG